MYKPIYLEEKKGMKFRPLHDRVVVQRMESEQKTAGGIIIPDTAKSQWKAKSLPLALERVTKQGKSSRWT